MRPTICRLASSLTANPLSDASVSLLPPLLLYRRLLRVHRTSLPHEMRSLGDVYVKVRGSGSFSFALDVLQPTLSTHLILYYQDEFRRCRSIDNPIQIIGFLSQWKIYLDTLDAQSRQQTGTHRIGRQLSEGVLEKVSDVCLRGQELLSKKCLRIGGSASFVCSFHQSRLDSYSNSSRQPRRSGSMMTKMVLRTRKRRLE